KPLQRSYQLQADCGRGRGVADLAEQGLLQDRRGSSNCRKAGCLYHISGFKKALLLAQNPQSLSVGFEEERSARFLIHNNASDSHPPENILVRRVAQELIERHFLGSFRLLNQAQPRHIEQHSYELPMEVKQGSTDAFHDDLSIDPDRSVEF